MVEGRVGVVDKWGEGELVCMGSVGRGVGRGGGVLVKYELARGFVYG